MMEKIITLKGITRHGKNRIHEHGDQWEVLGLPPLVIKMSHPRRLPWIRSLKTGEGRWLDDRNFSWTPELF